jgi:hypothetical protein
MPPAGRGVGHPITYQHDIILISGLSMGVRLGLVSRACERERRVCGPTRVGARGVHVHKPRSRGCTSGVRLIRYASAILKGLRVVPGRCRPWEAQEPENNADLELLMETVARLCCDYGREPAHSLHPVIREWIKRTSAAMGKRTTLAQHRELLVCAGWLFLLSGCVEYDMGWRGAADASRIAALQIGRETGHGEIQAWSWEMAAWFALTQGRLRDVGSCAA